MIVSATVVVIDECGPRLSTERIAAAAGLHRTVLYRFFADRDDLYDAVAGAVADTIRASVLAELELGDGVTPRQIISSTVGAVIENVVGHPHLYRFLLAHGGAARLAQVRCSIADRVTAILSEIATRSNVEDFSAEPIAYGLIALVESTLSWWARHPQKPREDVLELLISSIWFLLEGTARDLGIDIAFDGPVAIAR